MNYLPSSQAYFNRHSDLTRCTSSQHARIWLVWYFANRQQPQALAAYPRWRELILCWLLHHATGLIMMLTKLRKYN